VQVLIPLPDRDFDTTEVAVPWHYLAEAGHDVVFATEHGGSPAECDPRLLTGVLLGQLGAATEPVAMYRRMTATSEYRHPVGWSDLDPADFDGLVLPGGHAPGMRQYLGSAVLREKVAAFWTLERPVGAICHGVLVLARTVDPATERSVICRRFTTSLPKYMERGAWLLTAWKLGSYYRTYPVFVQDEVTAALDGPSRFIRGPVTLSQRGTASDDSAAFSVRDGNYLSARWPGDAYLFAKTFVRMLSEDHASPQAAAPPAEPTELTGPTRPTEPTGPTEPSEPPLPLTGAEVPGGPFGLDSAEIPSARLQGTRFLPAVAPGGARRTGLRRIRFKF
jgi:putative intracellular protease/amidase